MSGLVRTQALILTPLVLIFFVKSYPGEQINFKYELLMTNWLWMENQECAHEVAGVTPSQGLLSFPLQPASLSFPMCLGSTETSVWTMHWTLGKDGSLYVSPLLVQLRICLPLQFGVLRIGFVLSSVSSVELSGLLCSFNGRVWVWKLFVADFALPLSMWVLCWWLILTVNMMGFRITRETNL